MTHFLVAALLADLLRLLRLCIPATCCIGSCPANENRILFANNPLYQNYRQNFKDYVRKRASLFDGEDCLDELVKVWILDQPPFNQFAVIEQENQRAFKNPVPAFVKLAY